MVWSYSFIMSTFFSLLTVGLSSDHDMAGRHRSRKASIQIIKTATVAAKDCKRVATLQMHVSNYFHHTSNIATAIVNFEI